MPYERWPTHTIGGVPSSFAGPTCWRTVEQPTTTTVASTGTTALHPSGAVSAYVTMQYNTTTRATHEAIALVRQGMRVANPPAMASTPPAINSHARVGSRKNDWVNAHSLNHTYANNDCTRKAPMTAIAYCR